MKHGKAIQDQPDRGLRGQAGLRQAATKQGDRKPADMSRGDRDRAGLAVRGPVDRGRAGHLQLAIVVRDQARADLVNFAPDRSPVRASHSKAESRTRAIVRHGHRFVRRAKAVIVVAQQARDVLRTNRSEVGPPQKRAVGRIQTVKGPVAHGPAEKIDLSSRAGKVQHSTSRNLISPVSTDRNRVGQRRGVLADRLAETVRVPRHQGHHAATTISNLPLLREETARNVRAAQGQPADRSDPAAPATHARHSGLGRHPVRARHLAPDQHLVRDQHLDHRDQHRVVLQAEAGAAVHGHRRVDSADLAIRKPDSKTVAAHEAPGAPAERDVPNRIETARHSGLWLGGAHKLRQVVLPYSSHGVRSMSPRCV